MGKSGVDNDYPRKILILEADSCLAKSIILDDINQWAVEEISTHKSEAAISCIATQLLLINIDFIDFVMKYRVLLG